MKINHSKPFFDNKDKKAVLKTLDNAYVTSGEQNNLLGIETAKLLNKKFAIPTQSGTDAIAASLRVLGLKPNAKIAIPAYICSAPLDAIAINNCSPKPIDIDLDTLAISINKINETKNISAILAAHLFGIPAPFHKITEKNIIEDCAQTLNCKINEHKVGSMGRFSICSFYGTKLLTSGHGGGIGINEEDLKNKLQLLFSHDKQEEWTPHLHYSLSDFNSALALSQMKKLDEMTKKRKEIALRYFEALGEKEVHKNAIYSRFIVFANIALEKLLEKFNAAGIEAKRPVFKPAYQYLNCDSRNFPNAKWAHEHIVSIPIYPNMNEDEINYILTFLEKHQNEMCCRTPA